MKRISFETAKLAAEKRYPTCQQQYYISQYCNIPSRYLPQAKLKKYHFLY